MLASILHRFAGVGLIVGLMLGVAWLGCLMAGPDAYGTFADLSGSWLGLIVWLGVTWSFFYHLAAGIRHTVWDFGYWLTVDKANALAWISIIFSVVATVALWGWLIGSGRIG